MDGEFHSTVVQKIFDFKQWRSDVQTQLCFAFRKRKTTNLNVFLDLCTLSAIHHMGAIIKMVSMRDRVCISRKVSFFIQPNIVNKPNQLIIFLRPSEASQAQVHSVLHPSGMCFIASPPYSSLEL